VPGSNGLKDIKPPSFNWSSSFIGDLALWMGQLGKPLALGIVLLALTLAFLGWVAVRVGWRWHVVHAWRKRARLRAASVH